MTLTYHDRKKPVIIQTEASKYGLGAALIQDEHSIIFASKTLTDIGTQYANIELDCLSGWFSLEKFHIYSYGKAHYTSE